MALHQPSMPRKRMNRAELGWIVVQRENVLTRARREGAPEQAQATALRRLEQARRFAHHPHADLKETP